MSQVLQTVYASAPINEVVIHTIELQHSAFDMDNQSPGTIRLCQGFDDVIATTENGETALFTASGLGISLPQRSVKGSQDLQFQLDNVTGEANALVDAAIEAGGNITVIYRAYASSDLSAPGQPPIKMKAVSIEFIQPSLIVIASFDDLINKAWPRRRYTPTFAPGLKYYG